MTYERICTSLVGWGYDFRLMDTKWNGLFTLI